jgi:hypothetical protein
VAFSGVENSLLKLKERLGQQGKFVGNFMWITVVHGVQSFSEFLVII